MGEKDHGTGCVVVPASAANAGRAAVESNAHPAMKQISAGRQGRNVLMDLPPDMGAGGSLRMIPFSFNRCCVKRAGAGELN